ncbi:MAG TPA: class I SAM-dependent methyltransferase [Terriglobales bacterium]|nr:class I SAM-dependent methyltransferase [Terriglobales bacterium]
MVHLPPDLDVVIENAWQATKDVPGFMGENEARFLGLLAACIPAQGAIVEIGSFKGRSTVMLAMVASHYGLGRIVSIDPHTHNLSTGADGSTLPSTYQEFQASLRKAGVTEHVEIHHAFSTDVSPTWNREIRFLWIDGDHTYEGAKSDFDGFSPFLAAGGVVALHDALNNFAGPIRVFVEEILRTNRFGPVGFVHSIAWAQFRPADASVFSEARQKLERRAARLLPFVQKNGRLRGLEKIRYKLSRSRVPRAPIAPSNLARLMS